MQPSNATPRVCESRAPTEAVGHLLASRPSTTAVAALLAALSAGCVLAPRGFDDERAKVDRAGASYAAPVERRELPELSAHPSWRELLARAFAANGALEAAYCEWRAALERVPQAAGYPNTNVAPSFSYLLSGSGLKAWDRTTIDVGFDPMQSLSLPSKVRKSGEIALARAREAGERFLAAKFALQREVLDDWLELTWLDEQVRIQVERSELADLLALNVAERARLSGGQRETLRVHVEQQRAELALAELRSRRASARVRLNAQLARSPDAPIDDAQSLPEPRAIAADDATLIAAAIANDPELAALAFAVQDRERSLELAQLQFLPDFNPFVAFTGNLEQSLGVGLSLPTRIPQLRAGVEEARALLSGARAKLRQIALDRRASFVAALTMLRFAEREAAFLATELEPAVRRIAANSDQAFSTGSANFEELIETQRALLDLRSTIADARIERERRLAELEELAGIDVETLEPRALSDTSSTGARRHE